MNLNYYQFPLCYPKVQYLCNDNETSKDKMQHIQKMEWRLRKKILKSSSYSTDELLKSFTGAD